MDRLQLSQNSSSACVENHLTPTCKLRVATRVGVGFDDLRRLRSTSPDRTRGHRPDQTTFPPRSAYGRPTPPVFPSVPSYSSPHEIDDGSFATTKAEALVAIGRHDDYATLWPKSDGVEVRNSKPTC